MKHLILLRHAEAGPKGQVADFDRALSPHGRDQMGHLASYLAGQGVAPDLALVSPASRTRETWQLTKLSSVRSLFDRRIYEASAEELLSIIQDVEEPAGTAMMVGHNPSLHDLARELIGFGDRHAAVRRLAELPTAGLVLLDLAIDTWREAAFRSARLLDLVTPSSLGMGEHG